MATVYSEISMKRNREIALFEGWRSLYHVKSDRMIDVRIIHADKNSHLYVDQECNVYPNEEFYHWKSTE